MHDDAAREVLRAHRAEDAAIGQKPAAPDPVGDRRIDQHHPERREKQHEGKVHPLCESAQKKGGGDDRKGHLEGEEQDLGQGAAHRRPIHPRKERPRKPAPDRAVAAEGDGITHRQPQHAHQRGEGETLHEDRQDVARPDKPAIEKREPRQAHHQDQRRRDQDPGGIRSVHHRLPFQPAHRNARRRAEENGKDAGTRPKSGHFQNCVINRQITGRNARICG